MPVHFFELLVFISLGLIAFRALGLVIASVANTMQEGTILVQLFYFPMLLLSGATFPAEKFPRVMKIIHNFIPATYLVKGMKNIMLKGQGLTGKENLLAVLRYGAYDRGRWADFHEAFPLGEGRKDSRIGQTLGPGGAAAVHCDGRLAVAASK